MTFDEVKAFIEEHKEDENVAEWLDSFAVEQPLDRNKILEFLVTAEGKELVQPMIDQQVTKAVKTRDKVHEQNLDAELKKRLAAEILKLNPQEEPWQKEIRELKEQNEKEKAERARADLKRSLVEEAAKMGVNPFFIEDYVPNTFEEGKLFLQKIKDHDKSTEERKVNELMASGFKPGAGADIKRNDGKMSAKEYAALPPEERFRMVESGEIANVRP